MRADIEKKYIKSRTISIRIYEELRAIRVKYVYPKETEIDIFYHFFQQS